MGAIQQVLAGKGGSSTAPIIVADAGTTADNGTYTFTGTHNSKNYYNKTGTSATVSAISWYTASGPYWVIWRASGDFDYYSSSAVATPDLASSWATSAGAAPVPTVTAG